MAFSYARMLRPALFQYRGGDAEKAHEVTLQVAEKLGNIVPKRLSQLLIPRGKPITLAGVTFPGRVGLAAGMDKNGVAIPAWQSLQFGHVECGTVTASPQPGNPQPRMFRLPHSQAAINRMGFNNAGTEALAIRLAQLRPHLDMPIGVSIGKTKAVALEEATQDYVTSLRMLHRPRAVADYVAVNVSSPNTTGLRKLQDSQPLTHLLQTLTHEADQLSGTQCALPIWLKIAPDLSNEALEEVIEVAHNSGVAGLIATNTTLERNGLAAADLPLAAEEGGLSGAPLTRRARYVVNFLSHHTDLPIIGVGGIMNAADGVALIDAGASMVQVYTGLIYRGPALISELNKAL